MPETAQGVCKASESSAFRKYGPALPTHRKILESSCFPCNTSAVFMLFLQECLEAEFYSWAAFGHGLNATLLGGGPGSTGGQKAVFLLESTAQ